MGRIRTFCEDHKLVDRFELFLAFGFGEALDGLLEEVFVVVEAGAVRDAFVVLCRDARTIITTDENVEDERHVLSQ